MLTMHAENYAYEISYFNFYVIIGSQTLKLLTVMHATECELIRDHLIE